MMLNRHYTLKANVRNEQNQVCGLGNAALFNNEELEEDTILDVIQIHLCLVRI
jgi:hypothetical protein